jgi:hypothetical protein
MARVTVTGEVALTKLLDPTSGARLDLVAAVEADDDSHAVLAWLGRLRLLDGVPFEYLVPDAGMLQPETIRFFHLDRNWTDAAVDGALAAGTYGTRDRAAVQTAHQSIRDALDGEERTVWGTTPTTGTTPQITGFLLRSRAVSGWPGLIVRGFRGSGSQQRALQPLRIERLSPSVLVALFDDEPTRVEIEEPRQGVQFGVQGHRTVDGRWVLPVRDASGQITDDEVDVPFRRGSTGVLHLTELRRRLAAELGAPAGNLTSADLAFHLLRRPYRQDFGQSGGGGGGGRGPTIDDLFHVVVDRELLLELHR